MGRVLFAGEMEGGGLAVPVRIAAQLAARGVASVFAVSSMAGAKSALNDVPGPSFGVLQAPRHVGLAARVPEPRNYVDLLLNHGFGDARLLFALINAWRGTLRMADASVLVVSGRPDALLAGRLAGLPVIQLSHGFGIPPAEQPLPVLRPWVEQAPERRSADEAQVLRNVNVLFDSVGQPRLEALHQLYQYGTRLIASLPELDPHGPRADCTYCGSLHGALQGRRLAWPAAARRKVLVHLQEVPRTHARAMQTLLKALASRDSATHVLLPAGAPLPSSSMFDAGSKLNRIHRREVDWSGLPAAADLCVFDGDPGMAARCAMAGVPMICTPVSAEGFLLAQRVVAAGIGRGVGLVAPDLRGRMQLALRQLEQARRAARALARRHASLDADAAMGLVMSAITAAISSASERADVRAARSAPA